MRICILMLVVSAITGCGDDDSDDEGVAIDARLSNRAQVYGPATPPEDARLITRFEVRNVLGERIDRVSLSLPAYTTDTFEIYNLFPPDEDGNAFCSSFNPGRAVDICIDFEEVAISNPLWRNRFCTGLYVPCSTTLISCGAQIRIEEIGGQLSRDGNLVCFTTEGRPVSG